jgi:hypothetical protein
VKLVSRKNGLSNCIVCFISVELRVGGCRRKDYGVVKDQTDDADKWAMLSIPYREEYTHNFNLLPRPARPKAQRPAKFLRNLCRGFQNQHVPDRHYRKSSVLAPAGWLLVCGPGEQQQIPIRIFDDEILGAPRLLFQCLVKGNPCGLKFKKQ